MELFFLCVSDSVRVQLTINLHFDSLSTFPRRNMFVPRMCLMTLAFLASQFVCLRLPNKSGNHENVCSAP